MHRSISVLTKFSRGFMHQRKSAAVIIIGDEILKGSTVDTNSGFLARKLHEIGVTLKRVSIVGDTVEDISEEVRRLAPLYDVIITSGGVGPTHDDKTYEGIARAFNVPLEVSPEMRQTVDKFMSTDVAASERFAADRMCLLPKSSSLLWGVNSKTGVRSPFPIVKMNNVAAFPGVPLFCQNAFYSVKDILFPPAELPGMFSNTLFTTKEEYKFSDELTAIAAKYESKVDIGSYPVLKNGYFKTKLIVESEMPDLGQTAVNEIEKLMEGSRIFYDPSAWKLTVSKWDEFLRRQTDPSFIEKLNEAWSIVDNIVEKYPLNEIALSFNGGKDCTVLLHLLRIKIDQKYGPGTVIQGFHIMCEDQFPEVTQFIIDAAKWYNITVIEYPGPLKTGLEHLKRQRPGITAVFMGSRASDPKGKYMLSPIEWTDSDWPRVLRVCPILSWSYVDVWNLLRGLCVPYCSLYDQGYTSLGGRDDTFPNPQLRISNSYGTDKYLPAHTLKSGETERNGRSSL